MDGIACSGFLLKRGGLLKRWEKRFFALIVQESRPPALFYKLSSSDASWLGALPLDGASCGALPRGDGHPHAACFCAFPGRLCPHAAWNARSWAVVTSVSRRNRLTCDALPPTDVHRAGKTYVLGAGSEGALRVWRAANVPHDRLTLLPQPSLPAGSPSSLTVRCATPAHLRRF